MQSYRYLIVGGGMTADAACRGIRGRDPDGSIGLVGEELHPPYNRPPLSKALWRGKDEASIWRETAALGVELHLGRRVVSLDLAERRATDNQGEVYSYERLLLATGGRPRRLPFGGEDVVYFRTLDDYRRLRDPEPARAVVIGGGFIGSEIAAALTANGWAASLVFPDAGIGARLFPAELAAFLVDYYRSQGVEVRAGETVTGVERAGGGVRVTTGSGAVLEANVVVAGLGIEPNVEVAAAAGLATGNGIGVDDRGRAGGRADVFAAGDVARFPAAVLGTELRVEHEDHAKSHGAQVGANMAGADEPYDHLPFFYSDLFDLGYEAVGEVDSRLETLVEWAEPNRKGVVCYLDGEGRPRGFLLWDVWGKVDEARLLIGAGEPIGREQLAKLIG